MVAWMRAFSRETAWARSASFQRSGAETCSLSSAARFSSAGRSKMPPELGHALEQIRYAVPKLSESHDPIDAATLCHGPRL